MKIKVHLSVGLVGCRQECVIEVPDDEIEGMNDDQRQEVFDDYARDWAHERLEWGWEVGDGG